MAHLEFQSWIYLHLDFRKGQKCAKLFALHFKGPGFPDRVWPVVTLLILSWSLGWKKEMYEHTILFFLTEILRNTGQDLQTQRLNSALTSFSKFLLKVYCSEVGKSGNSFTLSSLFSYSILVKTDVAVWIRTKNPSVWYFCWQSCNNYAANQNMGLDFKKNASGFVPTLLETLHSFFQITRYKMISLKDSWNFFT